MLKQAVRSRLKRAEDRGPGAAAWALLGFVAVVAIGIGAILTWLVWSNLSIGVGLTGGIAIVASAGLFVWSESRPQPRKDPDEPTGGPT
jgi:hypothetical protein